ncbi:hypothetical protein BG000_002862 [Podila horticola]|nr:hypothetical protein BG000_002862 [Podila horticola]
MKERRCVDGALDDALHRRILHVGPVTDIDYSDRADRLSGLHTDIGHLREHHSNSQQIYNEFTNSTDPRDLKPILPNDDAQPVWIESDEFVGQVVVRIRGFNRAQGGHLPDVLLDSSWFQQPSAGSNLISVQIQGRFKREWAGDQVVFGVQFDQPLRLPPFSSLAFEFVKFFDPGVEGDIEGEKPWVLSPLIVTMNTVSVSNRSSRVESRESPQNRALPPWPSRGGEHIVENTAILFGDNKQGEEASINVDLGPSNPIATNASKRRSHFSKVENRAKFVYKPDQVFGFDFFNAILDLAKFKLRVPGVSFDITKPLNGQPLTFVMKSKDSSVVFLVVQFKLVPLTGGGPSMLP